MGGTYLGNSYPGNTYPFTSTTSIYGRALKLIIVVSKHLSLTTIVLRK